MCSVLFREHDLIEMSASHVEVIASIVKPMATLILSRKLYMIAALRSVELPDKAQVNIVLYGVLATQTNYSMFTEA